jgi:hypothetical protein
MTIQAQPQYQPGGHAESALPGQSRPGQNHPGHDRPGQNRPGQDHPGQDHPGQDHPGQDHPGHDRPTHGIAAGHVFEADAFTLLDLRTRRRTISREHAPPGRYLEVEDGDRTRLIPLERPIVHIGRGLISDVRLEDPGVSRRHAIIAQRGDGTRVLDDRSSNGTFVNGRQVTVTYLNDGDVVRIGRVVFRFVEVAPQTKAAPVRRRIPMPVRAPGDLMAGSAA